MSDDGGAPRVDAVLIQKTRDRLERSAGPSAGDRDVSALLALAERVAAKLPAVGQSRTTDAAAAWPSARMSLGEFVSQALRARGAVVEWLPVMTVGAAGERGDAGITSKPGQAGHFIYGPYGRLEPGTYSLNMRMAADPAVKTRVHPGTVATIEIVSGTINLVRRHLRLDDLADPEHRLSFRVVDTLHRSAVEL